MLILNQPNTSSQATILITDHIKIPQTDGEDGILTKAITKDREMLTALNVLPDAKIGDILDVYVVTGDTENPHEAGNYYIDTCIPAPVDFFNS